MKPVESPVFSAYFLPVEPPPWSLSRFFVGPPPEYSPDLIVLALDHPKFGVSEGSTIQERLRLVSAAYSSMAVGDDVVLVESSDNRVIRMT